MLTFIASYGYDAFAQHFESIPLPFKGSGLGGDGVEPLHNSWCWMQIQSQIPMINAINKLISLMMHRSLIELVWDRLCHAKSIQHREIVP